MADEVDCKVNNKGKTVKKRGQKWSNEQNVAVISAVTKYYRILFGSLSAAVNMKKKTKTWIKIQSKVNSVGGTARTVEQIKEKFKNIKAASLSRMRSYAKHVKGTGGGGPVDRPEEEDFQLCSLLGFAKVLGLENGQESDVLGSYTPPDQSEEAMEESDSEDEIDMEEASNRPTMSIPDIRAKMASYCNRKEASPSGASNSAATGNTSAAGTENLTAAGTSSTQSLQPTVKKITETDMRDIRYRIALLEEQRLTKELIQMDEKTENYRLRNQLLKLELDLKKSKSNYILQKDILGDDFLVEIQND